MFTYSLCYEGFVYYCASGLQKCHLTKHFKFHKSLICRLHDLDVALHGCTKQGSYFCLDNSATFFLSSLMLLAQERKLTEWQLIDRSFICPQKIKLQSYLHYLQSYNGLGTFGNPIGLLGKAPRH